MKTIKTLLLVGLTPFLLSGLTSCTDYQDEIDALDVRVAYLESLASKVNDNIVALQKIVNTISNSGYIKNVETTQEGCIIYVEWIKQKADGTFVTSNDFFIIQNGKPGTDATMPNITLEKDPSDGNYYWKLNGDWLKDSNGNRVQANGISPQVKIDPSNNHWYISSDGGKTWEDTGVEATGQKGNDGQDGQDGQDGDNAPILVRVVSVDYINGYVTLEVLGQSGQVSTIKVPLIP